MTPNYDPNHGKKGFASPEWHENMGRFARLPRKQITDIARKGGLAKSEKKRVSSQINPIKTGKATSIISISHCDDCPINKECPFNRQGMACQIELELRRNIIGQFKAIVGLKPEDMFREMFKIYTKLEEEVLNNPSYYNLMQLMYLQIRIFEMKFGKIIKERKD